MANQCLRVGLTGGIGSGKTTVSDLFAALDVPIIDADVIARELLAPGSPVTRQVIDRFGDVITSTPDTIDRARLRELVFNDPGARKSLEDVIHPRVHDQVLAQAREIDAPYCIIVIPLLFEAGHQDLVDRILVIDSPVDQQIERASRRDHASKDAIRKIIESQLPSNERRKLADDVIDNNGSLDELEQKVRQMDRKYRELAQHQTA